ncbi:Uncharacterized protein Rs2_04471 [Raphanus sativus]|nr:Uncharacterized protein Rs2_04471 [Raphanus sativus]
MIDRVLEGQQKLTVDFNGKIDSVFNNLTTRIDTICTQVKKLETQIVQTEDSIRRIRTSKEVGEGNRKHHVNAIINDDFWQVVKQEKLQEGDFEVKSSLSFGGSQWCRSTPISPHRSTSTMQFPDTTADCNAVRILTHAEFTASHPYPPTHTYEDIDRRDEPLIDRHKDEKRIDRPFSPPIDRHAPLTYRVQLPSIDINRINALRPTPRPQANPTEITGNPSDTTPTSEGTEGRRLRSRKEKIPKNLKREANEKEIDGFTKRVIRIPPEKPFEERRYEEKDYFAEEE